MSLFKTCCGPGGLRWGTRDWVWGLEGCFGLGRVDFWFTRGGGGVGCNGFWGRVLGGWGGTGWVLRLVGWVFGSGGMCLGMGDYVWGIGSCSGLGRGGFGLVQGGVGLRGVGCGG